MQTNDPNVHLKALQRAIAAGDHEAADYIRQQLVRAYQDEAAVEGNPAQGGADVLGMHIDNPTIARGIEGVGQGLENVGRHVANVVGLESDADLAAAKERDAPLLDTTAGKVGSFIGEAAASAPIGMGTGAAVERLGSVGAKVAGNLIVRGAIEGAAQGAALADPGRRTAGAVLGSVAGAALPAAGAMYRAARSGVNPTKAARTLLNEGVDLSPGQMNPKGVMNKIEQMPVVSDLTAGVRDRAEQQFQQKAIQKAAPPGVRVAQAKPDQMLDQVYRSFSPLYDQARGFPVNPSVLRSAIGITNAPAGGGAALPPVAALGQALANATRTQGVRATAPTRAGVDQFLKEQLTAISKRNLSSDDLLDLRSAIRAEGRKARLSPDAQEQAAAELLSRAEQVLTKGLNASISKPAQAALQIGDQHYRVYKVLEDAVARASDRPKGFSPTNLSQAVRASTPRGAYARGGGGDLREMAAAGREALDPTEPKTGYALGKLTTMIAGALAAPKLAIPAALAGAGLIGTQTGRRIAAGRAAPQLLARELEREIRRAVPRDVRQAANRYARTALVLSQQQD